jgi:signal transduction histidine kinase
MSHSTLFKILPLFFAMLFAIVASIFYNQHNATVLTESNKQIEMILKTNKALHAYIENIQKPVIYNLQGEGKLYQEFFDPKVLSFTYIARNIHEQYAKREMQNGHVPYSYKLATTNPRNPINKATPFEKEILNKFKNKDIKDYSTFITENNEKYYYKAMPIDPNKESCMKCHSTPDIAPKELIALYGSTAAFGEKVGDIRAMISLKIPVSSIIKNSLQEFYISILVVGVLFLLFYIILVALLKKDASLQKTLEKLEESNLLLSKSIEEVHEKSEQLHIKDALIAEQSKMSALGEMMSNVAHQWRQPLSVIASAATGLQVQKEFNTLTDEKFEASCELINKNTQYLSNIIENFAHYIDNNNTKQYFNLSDMINNFLDIVNPEVNEHQLHIILELEENIQLNSFPSELLQCFVNIFNNSKEAFQTQNITTKYIFITAFTKGDKTSIIFKDNAGGIPNEVLPKVFEPYFTTKHKSQGKGLGLHLVYKLVEETMEGEISAQNVNFTYNSEEYNGAEFTIIL